MIYHIGESGAAGSLGEPGSEVGFQALRVIPPSLQWAGAITLGAEHYRPFKKPSENPYTQSLVREKQIV